MLTLLSACSLTNGHTETNENWLEDPRFINTKSSLDE